MPNITVPPAVNYLSPLVAVPSIVLRPPKEGDKLINCEIDWGTQGGSDNCVSINLQNNATLEFSQIVALSVDNSACAADIQFVFPDTGNTLTVPAYAPSLIIEVFTNQTQFFVISPSAQPEDVTRFAILNHLPPPVAVPFTVEQQTLSSNNITADGSGTNQLLPDTISGTLENLQVFRCGPIATGGTQFFVIKDGTGAVLTSGQFSTAVDNINVILLNLDNMHIRFNDGLVFTQSGADLGGAYIVNGLYRAP